MNVSSLFKFTHSHYNYSKYTVEYKQSIQKVTENIHGSKVNTSHPIPNCLLTNQKVIRHVSTNHHHKTQQKGVLMLKLHQVKYGNKSKNNNYITDKGKISTPLNLDLFHSLPMTVKTPSHLLNQLDTIHLLHLILLVQHSGTFDLPH